MRKHKLDERQEQVTAKVGALSFYVMFFACAIVIIGELVWKGSLENVLGETIVLLSGGITCLWGFVRNGIWTSNNMKMTVGQRLLGSIVCSGIFSVFYAFLLTGRVSNGVNITKYVVLFFVGISVLCFICLTVFQIAAKRKAREQEQKYSE